MPTRLELHVADWKDCVRCDLHKTRKQVVIWRGQCPADVLFVGEAPGESENVLGYPFVGPAGKMLDLIVSRAFKDMEVPPSTAYTNVVACIPRDDDGEKLSEPSDKEASRCRPRLVEFVKICQPKVIVQVGKVAEMYVRPRDLGEQVSYTAIIHPAAILRAPYAGRSLLVKRAVATLRYAVENPSKASDIPF